MNSDGEGAELGVDDKTEEELGGKRGVAETLYQNVRRVINRKRDTNPEEYRKFSEKIDRLLEEYQQSKIEYKELLKQTIVQQFFNILLTIQKHYATKGGLFNAFSFSLIASCK